MKQLLFLLLFPAYAMAQYPGNAGQKITLGEQTTADGLVWRGRLADTANLLTNKLDTSVYIVLDTATRAMWYYRASTTPKWNRVVDSLNNLQGTLSVAKGGTGVDMSSLPNNYLLRKNSSGIFDTSLVFLAGGNVGIGVINPSQKLHVNGHITVNSRIYGPSVNSNIRFNASDQNRIDLTAADGFFISGPIYPSGNLQLQRTGDATSTATQKSSNILLLQTSMWTGSTSAGRQARIWSEASQTTNDLSRVAVATDNENGLTEQLSILSSGKTGIGTATPTAVLHLKAGTATASTAPLKFTSGTNLTTAEAGAMEFNGTNLFFSPSTTRHTVNHGLTGSATLDFPSTTTLLSADLTITVTGAADGDVVSLGVPNAAVNANTCYTAWVSATNTVTVRFNNYSSGTVNPASGTFKVFVTK